MRRIWQIGFITSLIAALSLSVACGARRGGGGGGDDDNNGGLNNSSNNGATPSDIWGRGGNGNNGGSEGFGFGQNQDAGGNNGQPGGEPGTANPDDCAAACSKIGECFSEEVDADDLAQCPAACAAEAYPGEVACILDNSCDSIIGTCVTVDGGNNGAVGTPADAESCGQACSKIFECIPDLPSSELSACVTGCTSSGTSAEVSCVLEASCSGLGPACFGTDIDVNNVSPNNSSNNSNNAVPSGDCQAACEKSIECFGEDIPPEFHEQAITECVTGCTEEGTPSQIACVLSSSCETIEQCGPGPSNNATNNNPNNNPNNSTEVPPACFNACSYLVFECSEYETEEQCYSECATWGLEDEFCVFESSCADWRQCIP